MPTRSVVLCRSSWVARMAATAAVFATVACQDAPPVAPRHATPHGAYLVAVITCDYVMGQRLLPCAEQGHATGVTLPRALEHLQSVLAGRVASGPRGVRADVLLGQQGVNVYLGITGVTYDSSLQVFSFSTTVQDRTAEPLGTADGRTPASDSIKVFFQLSPVVTSGAGAITIMNADGIGTFTASNQPYYRYPGLLPSNATTAPPKLWQMSVPRTVQRFTFSVYVTGQVPDTSAAALAIPPHTFSTLAVGEAHTCAVRPTNHTYCWGFNNYGAVGVGMSAPVVIPTGTLGTPSGALLAGPSAGSEFSCGVGTDQLAYCWGDNLSGELGDGSMSDRGEPASVTGGLTFTNVETGNEFACGLSGGLAYCWGDNYVGQLGDNTTTSHIVPALVGGGLHFVALASGAFHACGLTASGSVYCWGDNAAGELGNGSTATALTPTLVSGSTQYGAIAAGNEFTCALDLTGKAYCWGANAFGALGIGAPSGSLTTPTLVHGGLTYSAITAGGFHTCGLSTGGATYCWGSNESGQVGDGTQTDRTVPTAVLSGPFTLTSVGAGFRHSCGVTASGAAYCWGNNDSGQLGDGTTTLRTSPTVVLLP